MSNVYHPSSLGGYINTAMLSTVKLMLHLYGYLGDIMKLQMMMKREFASECTECLARHLSFNTRPSESSMQGLFQISSLVSAAAGSRVDFLYIQMSGVAPVARELQPWMRQHAWAQIGMTKFCIRTLDPWPLAHELLERCSKCFKKLWEECRSVHWRYVTSRSTSVSADTSFDSYIWFLLWERCTESVISQIQDKLDQLLERLMSKVVFMNDPSNRSCLSKDNCLANRFSWVISRPFEALKIWLVLSCQLWFSDQLPKLQLWGASTSIQFLTISCSKVTNSIWNTCHFKDAEGWTLYQVRGK